MVNLSECPAREDLRRFALGALTGAEAETVEQHLDTCERCLETLHVQESGDTLVDSLRGPAAQAAVPDELVEAMVQRIGTLRHNAPVPSQETDAFNTPVVDRGIDTPTNAAERATGGVSSAEDLDFLAPAEQPGELGRLGSYRILHVLGSGGMGVVFVAEDPQLQRRVALKVMRPSLAASKTARQRFLREARLAAKIEHDHLVHIYQVGEDRGMPFLAMQLLKGESLEERLRRAERLPVADAIRIGREIAEGLAAAHGHGLIHRDIKPANVFLESRGQGPGVRSQDQTAHDSSLTPDPCLLTPVRVKILDFGLARAVADDAHITGSGVIAGTPAYMAPEQARAETVDARTDLFSLGCVLYRMVVGKTPFRGANTTALLMSLANDQPAAPADVHSETSRELSDLVMHLLAKNPAERPGSARELVEALTKIERQLSDDKVTRWQGDKVTSGDTIPATTSPGHPVTLPPRHRSSRRWVAAAAVLLALLGGGWYAAQIIIRMQTEHGVLIVEVDDENLEAVVDKDVIKFRDLKNMKHVFELAPGKGVVIFRDPATGNELFSEKFELKRGGTVQVRAQMEIIKAARAKLDQKKPEADPDRRAAEWVLRAGGSVDVLPDDTKEPRTVSRLADLPADPYRLHGIALPGSRPFIHLDKDLQRISMLRALQVLQLSAATVSDKGLIHLRKLTNLRYLALDGTEIITDVGLEHLRGISGLRALYLKGTKVTAAGVKKLAAALPQCMIVSDHGTFGPGSDADRRVAEWVFTAGGSVDVLPDDMKEPRTVSRLADLPTDPYRLHGIALTGSRNFIDLDKDLQRISMLRALQVLQLTNATVSDKGLIHLRNLTNLRYLALDGTEIITDVGLEHLRGISGLRALHLKGTKVTAAGVKKLAAALPNCTIESDHGTFGPK